MQKVVAKFSVQEMAKMAHYPGEKVRAGAVSGTVGENASFAQYTPSGSIELLVNNPAIEGFFELGAEYYVTFERAPKAPTP